MGLAFEYVASSGILRRKGRPDLTPFDTRLTLAQREAQVVGDPLTPPGPNNTGLRRGWTRSMLTPFNPTSGTNIGLSVANAVYENRIFWGEVRPLAPGISFINCVFAGKNPTTVTDINIAMPSIKCYGDGYYQHTLIDCVIDPGAWLDPSLVKPGGVEPTPLNVWRKNLAGSIGLHGGRSTMIRCEVVNTQDAFNFVQTQSAFFTTSGNAADDPSFILLERCWIHGNIRYKGPDYTASIGDGAGNDSGTHSDGFQANTGRNITIRGCYIGGVRDEEGYSRPGTELDPQYNSGDDAYNAGILIKQEVDNTDVRAVKNILIEKNIFEGGGDTVWNMNHAYTPSRPNNFSPMAVNDNMFVRKPSNKYIIRYSAYAGYYSNNRVVDKTGTTPFDRTFTSAELVTATNG